MMTRTFRVRGTGFSNPRFAKPDENCLVGVPVNHQLEKLDKPVRGWPASAAYPGPALTRHRQTGRDRDGAKASKQPDEQTDYRLQTDEQTGRQKLIDGVDMPRMISLAKEIITHT